MKTAKKIQIVLTTTAFSILTIAGFSIKCVYADNKSEIIGEVYTFEEKDNYNFLNSEKSEKTQPGVNTYGTLSLNGNYYPDNANNGIPSYSVSGGDIDFTYSYTDQLLNEPEDKWHLTSDNTKSIADIQLGSTMKKGAIILQTSKDGKIWIKDKIITDAFAGVPAQSSSFYTTNSIQLTNGCYYRIIVAWKLGIKTGEKKGLFGTDFGKSNIYEYKKTAEVYEFYLHDTTSEGKSDTTNTLSLGTVTNTGHDNGYSGSKQIGIDDPHYGWDIGTFFVSGYTRETEKDNKTVFLKNVGDEITLWFNLKQNISQLNDDPSLTICEDLNGYDQYFQTPRTNMGKGTLIIRYTDEKGIKQEPELYVNYLAANVSMNADTRVKLFEEGDYEVALDYEIKKAEKQIFNIEIPKYSNYRLFFKFSVRNGNCMVYPFDVKTKAELSDGDITQNGFKLDMAKSRYLNINVQQSAVSKTEDGYREDIRFNKPAKDGDEYIEEGIYTFTVKNLYTDEKTTKVIYVGDTEYMKALSKYKISVTELNDRLSQGGTIADDGTIITSIAE